MKNLKYLLLGVTMLFCGCTTAPKNELDIDPVIQAERESLISSNQYGVYKNGKSLFLFDKTTYQLCTNPTKHTYRIINNDGTKYLELRLDGTPNNETGVGATQKQKNMNLQLSILGKMILLKSDNEKLWLWSDEAHVGFIVPKGGI